MALVSLTAVQQVPGLAGVNSAWLVQLIDAASAAVERYCKRKFELTERTEYYSGNGQSALPLRQYPVESVADVWFDATGYWGQGANAFTADPLVAGSDYALAYDGENADGDPVSQRGLLVRVGGQYGTWVGWYPQNYWSGKLAATRLPVWAPGQGNFKVQYTAGYATIPDDLQNACTDLVAWAVRNQPNGGPIQSEGIGSYNYSMGSVLNGTTPELFSARQVLARYRQVAF